MVLTVSSLNDDLGTLSTATPRVSNHILEKERQRMR
jgi:hypothetical protein